MNRLLPVKPVVALDIDGTSGDYHGHFLRFAAEWYGRPMPDPAMNTHGEPLYKWMHTSKAKYRQCKLAFRQGGLKRSMPCYPDMRKLTVELRSAGAQVWICTTRPYLRLDNIDPDTREWLRRNGIQYDAVLYGENKYRLLAKHVGANNIVGVVDDLPAMCSQAWDSGLSPVLLRNQPYNANADRFVYRWDHRVDDAEQMYHHLMKSLAEWKSR